MNPTDISKYLCLLGPFYLVKVPIVKHRQEKEKTKRYACTSSSVLIKEDIVLEYPARVTKSNKDKQRALV